MLFKMNMSALNYSDAQVIQFHAARLCRRLEIAAIQVLQSKKIRKHNVRLQQSRELAKEKLRAAQPAIGTPLTAADIDLLIDQLERV